MTPQTPEPTIPVEQPPIEVAVDRFREACQAAEGLGAFGSVVVKMPYQAGKPGRPKLTVETTLE